MSSKRPADTRDAILDAARNLFEVDGYQAVGLEAVAKKAGVSRQAIYLHFDSRAALLQALHERVNAQDVAPAMERVWRQDTALDALDAFITASAKIVPKIIGIANALEAPRRVDAVVEATWEVPKEGRYADCWRMAEWLKHEGELASGTTAREAADVLFMMTSIRSFEALVISQHWSPQRWTRWVRRTLGRVLLDET